MKVSKVCKLEMHMAPQDRALLLRLFDENRLLARITYNVMRMYGYLLIVRNAKAAEKGGRVPKCPREVVGIVKKCMESYDEYAPLRKWSSELIDLQVNKVWESFVATYRAHGRMPGEGIIDSLGRVLRVRVSKTARRSGRFYSRMLTIYGEGEWLAFSLGRLVRGLGRRVVGLLGSSRDFDYVLRARDGDGMYLGDPAELVLHDGGRIFLHLPIIRNVSLPKQVRRIVGVDLGYARYFYVAVAYDLEEGRVVAVDKVPSDDLKHLWDYQVREMRKRMLAFRPKRGRRSNKYYRLFKRHFNRLLNKAKRGEIDYDSILELMPLPKRWLLPPRYKPNSKRFRMGRSRGGVKIREEDSLGRSLWRVMTRDFIYYCVNRLVGFARENGCQVIVCENLKGLRKHVKKLKAQSRKLGQIYQRTRSQEALREKRSVDLRLRMLSRFPYAVFLDDLETEAHWNGLRVKRVSPGGTHTTCPMCGYMDRGNRPARDRFRCLRCGYEEQAGVVAAINIAKRGLDKASLERERGSGHQ